MVPASLAPSEYSDAETRMAIPDGWTAIPVPAGNDPKLKAQFKKGGTGGFLQVY